MHGRLKQLQVAACRICVRPTGTNWYAALDEGIETSSLQQQWDRLEYLGKTVIWIAVDGTVNYVSDAVKPSSARMMQQMG